MPRRPPAARLWLVLGAVPGVLGGLVGCVDKTPPPLWPTPPPPPLATPIGISDAPPEPAAPGGVGERSDAPPASSREAPREQPDASPAPAPAAGSSGQLGPWQPASR